MEASGSTADYVGSNLRFSASLYWMFRDLHPFEAYRRARAAGFEGVEHSFPYDLAQANVSAVLRKTGLRMVTVYTPCAFSTGEKGFACVPGRQRDFRGSVEIGVNYALAVGSVNLGILAGEIPTGIERARCLDVLLENLSFAITAVQGTDLQILLEPVCRRRAPNFVIRNLSEGSTVLRALARREIKLCFDTYHVALEHESVLEALDSYWNDLGHIQIGNIPARNGPGEGELDLEFIVQRVFDKGWGSWIGCEYSPLYSFDPDTALSWTKHLRKNGAR